MALLVLDAKSCYDRIAQPIASLALQRWGLPQTNTIVMFNTIQNKAHYIRTSYGNSSYTYCQGDIPFHGILQGNGAGPAIWVAVSSPLLDRMRVEGCGIQIRSLHSNDASRNIVGFAFVDDCDLLQSLSANEDEDTAIIQKCLDTWVESLRSTGGTLVAEKSNWFKFRFRWENDRWHMDSKLSAHSSQIYMENDMLQREVINQLDVKESVLALGVQFSPSGQMDDQCSLLKSKASIWAEKVRSEERRVGKECW